MSRTVSTTFAASPRTTRGTRPPPPRSRTGASTTRLRPRRSLTPARRSALTVTLNATGTDTGGSGVLNVAIQRAPTGTSTWTTICTDATSPYSCSWNTTGVGDGGYDLRAVTTDNAGNATNSTIVSNRVVDNTAPTATEHSDRCHRYDGRAAAAGRHARLHLQRADRAGHRSSPGGTARARRT